MPCAWQSEIFSKHGEFGGAAAINARCAEPTIRSRGTREPPSARGDISLKSDEPTKERLLAEIAERMRVEEQLRAANRTLRTINRCNEALVRATEEIELAEAICRILVEDGGMRMAWVGYREENAARTIRRIAHAGFDDGYLDSIDVGWGDAPTGQGPTGVAIRTGELCSS